jgi:hypothetical protein
MAPQLLIYNAAVPVSSQKHADLSVKSGGDYGFARAVNAVPLTAVEFRAAAPEHVLVFAGQGDTLMPVAVLGTEADQNLFVDEQGRWSGRYVPAFVRRYPFVFAGGGDGKTFTLCIDESFAGCNRDGRGERLFDAEGERTQYLNTVLNFVKDYQAQFELTRAFCQRLTELDLLEPMQAQFRLPDGSRRSLTGFMAVSRAKLKALDDSVLAAMVRNDQLELLYLHLQSLGNFDALLRRIGARPEQAAAAGGDTAAEPDEDAAVPLH